MSPGICFSMHGDLAGCAANTAEIEKSFGSEPAAFGTYPGDRFYYRSK
jgi:hypothetical protein